MSKWLNLDHHIRLRRWGLKGGFAVLDQGIYSGANFLLNIFLARWFSAEIYGGYSVAFSIFLLISTVQVALIAEPMSIFGADQYKKNVITYLNHLLRIQWIGSLFLAVLIFLFTLFITNNIVSDAMIGMTISFPFILFYWYLRRALYIEMQSVRAMVASSMYSILLLLLIFLTRLAGQMNLLTAYLIMAISSLIPSLFILRRLGINFFGESIDDKELNSNVVNRELWNFGKWILSAYLAGWITSFSFPLVISILLNVQSAGAFRALQNLFLPFQQILAAITLLVLPWLARQKSDHGISRLFASTQLVAEAAGIVAVIYCALIVVFRHEILAFLYANRFYSLFDSLTIILAISTLLGSMPLILGLALRILGQPNIILFSKGYAAIFALILGIPLTLLFKMTGVLVTIIVGTVVEASILWYFYLRIKIAAEQPY